MLGKKRSKHTVSFDEKIMVCSVWKYSFSAVLLNLSLISRNVSSTTKALPGATFTKENARLRGYTFKSYACSSQILCTQGCLSNARCYSTNFRKIEVSHGQVEALCELNSDQSLDMRSLENDLYPEYGSIYSRYPKDDMDDCRWSGCQNNGFCVIKENSYICTCEIPWTGKFCETKIRLYNLTTLGATGRIGPDSNAGYSGTGLRDVDVKDGMQEWQVPITGKYSVEACGASGGDGYMGRKGGKGAKVSGVLTLSKGDKLIVLVGQKGSTKDGSNSGSGGGGTFVFFPPSSSVPILVAGGGGGGGLHDGLPGNDQPDGSGSAAGSSGAGGLVCQPNDINLAADSGSGAGYNGDGGCWKSGKNCRKSACAKGGGSSAKKFKGGDGKKDCKGGLGGGGACAALPGGGGGYSGGGVASDMVAGGGGSYKPNNTWSAIKGGCHEGDGYVSFTLEG